MARGADIAGGMARAASDAAAAARAARSEEERSRLRLRRLRREADAAAEEERSIGSPPSWASGSVFSAAWHAAAAPLVRAALSRRIAALKRVRGEALARAAAEEALFVRRRAERRRIEAAAKAAAEAARQAASLGPVPHGLEERARAAVRKACGATRSRRDGESRMAALREIVAIVSEWTEARRAQALRRTPSAGDDLRRPTGAAVPERIYLPIPYAIGKYAEKAGARYDRDAPPGSKWYVPPETPLGPFEPFLPLAYRERPPKFAFPPVRHGASSHNLWSVFDKESWDRIRHINYERTGRRCAVCGKQGGSLLRALDPSSARRESSVDCHEVWEWKVPDPGVSIGVQRLRGILVCCPDCHLMWHDGLARNMARAQGIEDEAMRYLMKRRSFVTRTHPVEVARQMREEAAKLRAHSDVALWIVDLTRLGKQDYMSHVHPVFVEANKAGVRPGQVAGLSFVTDSGQPWPARSAREVYGSLADLYSHSPRLPKGRVEEYMGLPLGSR